MIEARFQLDEYTTRVLDVVKGKYGLKNRNEALKRFIKEYGDEYVEPLFDEQVLRELDEKYERYIKKNRNNSMTQEEFDILFD